MAATSPIWAKGHITHLIPRILALLAGFLLIRLAWISYGPVTPFSPSSLTSQDRIQLPNGHFADKIPVQIPKAKPEPHPEEIQPNGDVSRFDGESTGLYGANGAPMQAIITPTMKGQNMSWLHDNFGHEWEINEYVVNDPEAANRVVKNRGNEAGVYLTYIIDHYDSLPATMVFLHGRRYEWHNDDPMYDGIPPLLALRIPYVQKAGYTSLRCAWLPGCPSFIYPARSNASHESYKGEYLYSQTFASWFPHEPVPDAVGSRCCAQFAVSRDKVLERPLKDYVAFREWLFSTPESSADIGFVMEYMWHVIFGQAVLNCAVSAEQCYCEKFGLCELDCKERGRCEGMYWVPPGWAIGFAHLPSGWPEKGQGLPWPSEGWETPLRPDKNETRRQLVRERKEKEREKEEAKEGGKKTSAS